MTASDSPAPCCAVAVDPALHWLAARLGSMDPTEDGSQCLKGSLGAMPVVCFSLPRCAGAKCTEWVAYVNRLRKFNCKSLTLVVTAKGVGRGIVLARDHINLSGQSPLIGLRGADGSPVFADLSGAYDARLRKLASGVAFGMDLRLRPGIFIAPAENSRDRWPCVNRDGGDDHVRCESVVMMAICAAAAQIPMLAVAIDARRRKDDECRLFAFIERFIQCCGSEAFEEIS